MRRNIVNGIYLQCDGFVSKSLYKDLHLTLQTKDKRKGGLLLDVVIQQSTIIFKLLACKDETLLIRRDLFLVLDLGFDVVDGI